MTITYDKQILIKRGNTVEASSYVGPLGELVLDTDTNRVYVHDGVTAGGTLVGDGVGTTYGNSTVASYLPTDPTITSLIANAGVQSANIAALVANAATQADQISTVSANITAANTNMKGYVDASISSANIGMKTYVDSTISANIAALVDGAPGVLDTLNELAAALGDDANLSVTLTNTLSNINSNISTLTSNAAVQAGLISGLQANVNPYGNSNVASYLTSYSGNISVGNVIFSDLSVQTTAYTGTQWRSNLISNVTVKPSWLSYVPGGKNQEGTQYGFDSGGMFFTSNANDDFAYPIQTNLQFHEQDVLEIIATLYYGATNNDHGLSIFSADTRPIWKSGIDSSRIAFQYNSGIPVLYGQTTANTAPGSPVLVTGNYYTVKFRYDPGNTVVVETFSGNTATGTPIDSRSVGEVLPAGDYKIGFDADNDASGVKSYFTNIIIRTLTNTVVNDIEVQGQITGNLIPSANVEYSLGNITHQWKDLWVSNTTIYVGGVPISVDGGQLLINGAPASSTGNLEILGTDIKIADGASETSINISPNPEGDAFIQIPNDATANTNNLRVVNETGNITVETNNGTNSWTFDTDGILTLPGGDVTIEPDEGFLTINTLYGGEMSMNDGAGNVGSIGIETGESAYITIDNGSGAKLWRFDVDGNLTLPGRIIGYDPEMGYERVSLQPSPEVSENFLFYVDQTTGTFNRAGMEFPRGDVNKAVTLAFPHSNNTTGYIYNQGTDTISGTELNNALNIMMNSGNVKITALSSGPTYNTWAFNNDATLTFPDDTVQTTAWTGAATQIANGTSNVKIAASNGNINFNVNGFNYGTIATTGGVAIGYHQLPISGNSSVIAIGTDSGLTGQGDYGIGIGVRAGWANQKEYTVAVGYDAGKVSQAAKSVSVGYQAGMNSQFGNAVAVGVNTGHTNQGVSAVAVGPYAGQFDQGQYTVAVGVLAGNTSQGGSSVAVGAEAGADTQGSNSVAVGVSAGSDTQGNSATALGSFAGQYNQSNFAIAVGSGAAYNGQGTGAIAIGTDASPINQGQYSIAIGAGVSTNAVQPNNSIIIDATASLLGATGAGLFINPVRQDDSNVANVVYYNTSTKEITYGPAASSTYGNAEVATYLSAYNGSINFTASPAIISGLGSITSVTANVTANVSVGGILKIDEGVHEAFQAKADATGVVEHDCSQGHIFYHTSPDANWTANFANLNLDSGYATTVSLIIAQGGTGFYPNVVQIGGASQTINWQGNTTPTPSTNRTDVATFSIINNSSTYTVLGQLTGF